MQRCQQPLVAQVEHQQHDGQRQTEGNGLQQPKHVYALLGVEFQGLHRMVDVIDETGQQGQITRHQPGRLRRQRSLFRASCFQMRDQRKEDGSDFFAPALSYPSIQIPALALHRAFAGKRSVAQPTFETCDQPRQRRVVAHRKPRL